MQEEYDLAAYHSSEDEAEQAGKASRKGGGVDWGGVGRRARMALQAQLGLMSAARQAGTQRAGKEKMDM